MKVLFLSRYGEGSDIAFRMGLDSNSVRLWIEDKDCKTIADGLVPKVEDWRPSVQWADLIFFDQNSDTLANIWEQIKGKNPCFGGSSFGHRLEDDRKYGHSIMNRIGLPRLESNTYKTLREVISHLKEHKSPHVIKMSGPKVEKHHLIVGQERDNSDAIEQVERLIEQKLPIDYAEVEEKKDGVEAGISGWFNGNNWVGPISILFEHKRSHDREIGYLTGETGSVLKYFEDPKSPFFVETLEKITPILRSMNYRGQINLGTIVGREKGERFIAPLEWGTRIGYPSWALEDELHVTPWAKIAYDCATGKESDIRVHYDWSVGVLLMAFGFPFYDKVKEISQDLVVRGLDENTLDHIHPMNLKINKNGKFSVASSCGYLCVSTGKGKSIHEAKDRAYQYLSQIKVPNAFHRWDIGDKIDPYQLNDLGILPMEESIA